MKKNVVNFNSIRFVCISHKIKFNIKQYSKILFMYCIDYDNFYKSQHVTLSISVFDAKTCEELEICRNSMTFSITELNYKRIKAKLEKVIKYEYKDLKAVLDYDETKEYSKTDIKQSLYNDIFKVAGL